MESIGSRLQLKPGFRYEIIPSVGILLLFESGRCLLRGRAYELLAPLLDGRYRRQEVLARLREQAPVPELSRALDLLYAKGYVIDVTTALPPDQLAFWCRLGVQPDRVEHCLGETRVAVAGFGDVDTGYFSALLDSVGVKTADDGDRAVVLTDDYLHAGLDGFNRRALELGRSWLIAKPVGTELWLGPLFTPKRTGCWECLAERLRSRPNRGGLSGEPPEYRAASVGRADLPTVRQAGFGLIATETAKWVVCGPSPELLNRLITLDMGTLEKHSHRLVRRLQCPSCGTPSGAGGDWWLRLTWNGGADSARRYPAEYGFGPPASVGGLHRGGLRRRTGGKGKRDAGGPVSALSEALAGCPGVLQGDDHRVIARLDELGAAAIRPNACMGFSRRQYADRKQWNARGDRRCWVPEPFDPTRRIEWTPVWSLTHGDTRFVPTAYCYYNDADRRQAAFARADSNGCAAGGSLEEAVLRGFMELVARDAAALWWHNRLRRPGVELAGFDDPYVRQLRDRYRRAGRSLWLLDITSDLGIPAFAAISACLEQGRPDAIILGFGAHFDPAIAVMRALTELNQSLPSVTAGNDFSGADPVAAHWWRTATLSNQPYLLMDETQRPTNRGDFSKLWSDDLHADVMRCARIAGERGLETLVLDQARLDTGLHVVKVIVPGLRQVWPRFGPGRLYDVPVRMGWLPAPLPESELNPYTIYL